jgi:hypothetical protein
MWRKPTLFTALSAANAPLIHTGESRRGAIGLPAHSAAELAGIGVASRMIAWHKKACQSPMIFMGDRRQPGSANTE